jgi:hypothetical protein
MAQLATFMAALLLLSFSSFPPHGCSPIPEDFVVLEEVRVIVGCQIWFTRLGLD